jgi:energy-coupling factor transporter ATP-binding protein EcfA2
MAKWLIDTVEISGGFLAGLSLKLPPGLTCIIGPRGSGKSTFAEAIRYTLFGTTGVPKARADLIQANLGAALVSLQTVPDQRSESFVVRRSYRQPASLTSSQSRSLAEIDVERGTFLPLDVYTSTEIEAIADESLGDKRRLLLDELIREQLRQIEVVIAERRHELEGNADAIRATERSIADLNEQVEEIGDAKGRLASLPPLPPGEEPSGLAKAAQQQQANESEQEHLDRAFDSLACFRQQLTDLVATHVDTITQSLVVPGSINSAAFESAQDILSRLASQIDNLLQQQLEQLRIAEDQLQPLKEQLLTQHAAQKAGFDQLRQKDIAASQSVQRRSDAEKEVSKLSTLEQQRQAARDRLRTLRDSRSTLKADYLLEMEKMSRLRSQVASRLQKESGGRVRIRVLENADLLAYQQMLTDGLRGARVRNHEDILNVLMHLRPEQLAQMIQDNDLVEFETHTSFGNERSAKILTAFRENLDAFALELVAIDDHVRIELDVSSGTEPHFKDAAELSRGQKCTALLPILLARRDSPLVIDQPEDNLDNHFIYETVVEAILRLKKQRQMIFITHNANIPVLGEAEFVVVMNSDGTRGYVEKAGTLDDCRAEIIDLLEGGEEAFELRRQRYART